MKTPALSQSLASARNFLLKENYTWQKQNPKPPWMKRIMTVSPILFCRSGSCYNPCKKDNTMKTDGTATDIEAKRRWVILGISYLCVLSFGITMQSVPPVLSLILADLNLSYAQGGLLMSLFALPGVLISIPAGMLADRYNQKSIGIASFFLIIIGAAIFASGNSLQTLVLGRIVSGIGAMTLMVLAPQLLARWFAGREMGIAMGIYNTGMPVGTIISLNLLSLLGGVLGWRASIWVSAGLAFVGLILFTMLFRSATSSSEKTAPSPEGFFRGIRLAGTSIWINGVAWLLFNAAVISMFTFTPAFLKAAGFGITSAGFVTSAIMWPTLVFSPLIGYLIDKIDRKRVMVVIGSLVSAILMALVPTSTGWMLGMMLLFGSVHTVIPVAIYALAPEVISPGRLGLGFGIMATCQFLGIVLGPPIAGAVRDVTGSYQASYALMAGFSLLIVPAMIVLGRRRSQISDSN